MPSGPSRRRTFCALLPELLLQLFTRQGLDKAQVVPRWMADVLRQLDQPKNFICGLPALLSNLLYAGAFDAQLPQIRPSVAHGLYQSKAPGVCGGIDG